MTHHKYDCVSGTALYALLLDALQINFTIQEMTYHMYLEIPVGNGRVLIESTDPLSGLTLGAEAVAAREAQYRAEEIDPEVYTQPIQAQIGLTELVGLSHFNAAVHHYNQQQLVAARQHLQQAIQWYPAERMYTFQAIVEALAVR
jgi:TolA-binding protein